jgi:hypothetical protein
MWEPQPLSTLRASKACRGENFTFFTASFYVLLREEHHRKSLHIDRIDYIFGIEETGS